MNKYKLGDKVIVANDPNGYFTISKKELIGKVLEISRVTEFNSYVTKQGALGEDIDTCWVWEENELLPLNRTIEDVQEGDLITTDGIWFRRVLDMGRSGKVVFTTYSWKNGKKEILNGGGVFSIKELIETNWTIVDETPKPETITINGKEYNKQEVEEVIKDLKSL